MGVGPWGVSGFWGEEVWQHLGLLGFRASGLGFRDLGLSLLGFRV